MRRLAEFGRFYGFTGIDSSKLERLIPILVSLIPEIEAKEKLEANKSITKDNIKHLAFLAYGDEDLAEKYENSMILKSTRIPRK